MYGTEKAPNQGGFLEKTKGVFNKAKDSVGVVLEKVTPKKVANAIKAIPHPVAKVVGVVVGAFTVVETVTAVADTAAGLVNDKKNVTDNNPQSQLKTDAKVTVVTHSESEKTTGKIPVDPSIPVPSQQLREDSARYYAHNNKGEGKPNADKDKVSKPEEVEALPKDKTSAKPIDTPAADKEQRTVRRGETLSQIADSRDADMQAARDEARKYLGENAKAHDVLRLMSIAMADSMGKENINKVNVGDKIELSPEAIKNVVDKLKDAGKITGEGRLALGNESNLEQIFTPKVPLDRVAQSNKI